MRSTVQDNYPIELQQPNIAPYKDGNTGVDYVWTFAGEASGPHLLVSAVVHGNEPCGAVALDWLLRREVRPTRGQFTLAFMNVAAYRRFDPSNPTASRWVDEDFNRVWSESVLDGPRDSTELRRAREVRGIVDQADYVLDIHSMQHKTAPLMMAGPLDKGVTFARSIGVPEIIVSDQGHAAGRRLRDYQGFGDPDSPKNALLIECGQHWEAGSGPLAIETTLRFLQLFDAVDPSLVAEFGTLPKPPPQRHLRIEKPVTIETDQFEFADDFRGMEVIPTKGSVIAHDGKRPVTTPFDDCVLVMPSR
ncbi:MAG: M14 family metallopeptidase, partial [Alphaproteobacteria bacterium]|nr:M14 family metallopeptidase [Alphaproteobacteria bacterium]